ncbi:MAG: alcohol dehydrogenase catalytic domain-containing protein [Planctomycetes bacterium]|nr:alcohol dehydrogenase catalytic domain-containing protein [Planctomycetota bacterium]
MKAALLTGIREVEVRDVPEPTLEKDTDVLLDVLTVGVCGSDMHYYRTGRIGEQVVQFPYRVGHECAGCVLKTGTVVEGLSEGDVVAVDPLISCGECDQCRAGREHTCRNQAFLGCPGQADGCLCERIVMPAASCTPVPGGVTCEQAALIEPFSIGLYAQKLAGDVAGKSLAILGSGPIGLCVLLAARAAGARAVYMTDIRDNRAELAGQMGATWTGNPNRQDIVAEILQAEPNGVDACVEAAGEQSTLNEGVKLLKPGCTLAVVGIPEVDRVSFEVASMRRHELTIQNVRRQNQCVEPAVKLVAAGEVNLDPMVTHRVDLDETAEIFDIVADYNDNAVKAMIEIRA